MSRIRNMGSATMKFNEGIIVKGSPDNNESLVVTGSATILGNLPDYVVVIDNDENSSGHVLKLATDGNGNGTNILEMEDGDGDTVFRARADGRFGFGPDGVSSMGAGTFVVGIDNSSHTSDIAISQRLQHLGDSDTYLDFPSNDNITFAAGGSEELKIASDAILVKQYIKHAGDQNTWINFSDNRIRLNAGGNNFLDCQDESSAPHKVRINNGGNNIDFVIKDNSGNVYFTADASTSRVGIKTDAPLTTLDVDGDVRNNGAVYRKVRDEGNTSNITTSDYCIRCIQTGAITLTLPSKSNNAGQILVIKDALGNAGSHNITIAGHGSGPSQDKIDGPTGSTSYVLNVNHVAVTLMCDGINGWMIVAKA